MKKIYAFAFIIIISLLLPISVRAESQPNENNNGYEFVTYGLNYRSPDGGHWSADVYSHYKLCAVKGDLVGYSAEKYVLCTAQNINDELYLALIDSVIYTNDLKLIPRYDGTYTTELLYGVCYYDGALYNGTGQFQSNWSFQMSSTYANSQNVVPIYDNLDDALTYITTPDIDFEQIYYSAQIPVPSIDVYMGSDINNPASGEAVWNASMEFEDNSQYYIQYGYKITFPSYIDVGLASLRGDYSYNYYNYVGTNYIDIVNMQSLTTAVNQSKSAAYFQNSWQSFYDDYLTQSLLPQFGSQVNAMNQSMIDNAKDYYVDYMMTQLPMYGNRLEVFARYFTIDEENDNRVIVGAWNHWNSKDGSRTKERPSNYIDNVALPGNIITNSDPDYQTNTDTYTSNGDSTGTPATIINNNYAPNYPDYPTVATYNHDNILLNFMDTAKQLPSFFGEFTGFLTVAFGFIPSWIWTIIGMGFTFSIVIMIIKVL